MRALSLLLGFALVLVACDSASPLDPLQSGPTDQSDPIDLDALSQDPASLVGTWDWEASVVYFTYDGQPILSTPESSGRTQTYIFGSDGTLQVYENGALYRETTYSVDRQTFGNGTQEARASLRFGDGGREGFGTDGDLLVLDSTPVDGPQSTYRRR